ncbi:coiled coil protein [Legionella gratiana]|uniref:Coiled coil protein n=1 Tax=Legionella gratiana TaxID=45066 RepID=A0A378J064_9GAMM|nr:hypothetical protein [Legionella gratiana]KTD11803.1 coiled coil protein [Legionella gratiana]STX40718.1 coiled coil protein [Legionella gratiana]
MPYLATMSPEDVINVVKPKMDNLQRIMTLNTQIIVDTNYDINIGLKRLFKSGKIEESRYEEELKQNKKELSLRQKAHNKLELQLQRINRLQEEAQGETLSFVIEKDIHPDELKNLIVLTKMKIAGTEDKNEKLFLSIMLQTALSCKTQLNEQRSLTTQEIPILKNEKRYASNLLEELQNFGLDQSKPPAIIPKLGNIGLIKPAANEESLPEISALESQMTSISTGFKEFINRICTTINKEPVFNIPDDSISTKVPDFKEQLKLIKTETDHMEQSGEISNVMGLNSK